MSVQEAQDIAVKFKGAYKTPPPRGLGRTLESMIAYYETPPNVPQEFKIPQKKYTDEELSAIFGQRFKGGRKYVAEEYWRHLIENEYLNGNISLALRFCSKALSSVRSESRQVDRRPIVLATQAILLATVGDYKTAEAKLNQARAFYDIWRSRTWVRQKDPNYVLNQYYIERAQAAVALARGDLDVAEEKYYHVFEKIENISRYVNAGAHPLWYAPLAKNNLARTLILQDKLFEAEIQIRAAIELRQTKVMPHCLITLSDILLIQGRYQEASDCARTALHIVMTLRTPIDAYIRANAREAYAHTFIALRRWDDALYQYNMLETELKTDLDTFNRRFKHSAGWGLALLMKGEFNPALKKLDHTITWTKKNLGSEPYRIAELKAFRALALNRIGRQSEALADLGRQIPLLIDSWWESDRQTSGHKIRLFKLELILEAYIGMLEDTNISDREGMGFALAGTLQNQIVGTALASSSVRTAVGNPELADMIRQRQDLEIKVTALRNSLTAICHAERALQNEKVTEELLLKIEHLQSVVGTLDMEIHRRYPQYASMVNPDRVEVGDIRRYLKSGEAFIYIFTGRAKTFVWAIPYQGNISFSEVPINRKKMKGIVEKLRKALDPENVQLLDDIPAFNVDLAYELYRLLLEPISPGWKQAKSLYVVAQGPLGQIPLSLLPLKTPEGIDKTGVKFSEYRQIEWLTKTHAITRLPSTSAFINLRSGTVSVAEANRLSFAGFGDPYFNIAQLEAATSEEQPGERTDFVNRGGSFQIRGIRVTDFGPIDKKRIPSIQIGRLHRLPDTREEIFSIAAVLEADFDRDVMIGTQASEHRIRTMDLSNRRIIVFATHGLAPGDIDGLWQPALAFSAPEVTGDHQDDGLLTMGEIMGLRLDADWVVLSACNTAAADGAGAEAISGLGLAFFYAGARSLLVTAWPVETVSARKLTTTLFRMQKNNPEIGRAEILRQTMINLIGDRNKAGFSYAHPIFWAPFMLVGNGD